MCLNRVDGRLFSIFLQFEKWPSNLLELRPSEQLRGTTISPAASCLEVRCASRFSDAMMKRKVCKALLSLQKTRLVCGGCAGARSVTEVHTLSAPSSETFSVTRRKIIQGILACRAIWGLMTIQFQCVCTPNCLPHLEHVSTTPSTMM